MGRERSHLSKIERGEHLPTVDEIVALAVIFGRSTDSLLAGLAGGVRMDLNHRLETLLHPASTGSIRHAPEHPCRLWQSDYPVFQILAMTAPEECRDRSWR